MEFRIFPNYETFIQRTPGHNISIIDTNIRNIQMVKKDHYNISSIHITSNGAFWFTTNKKKQKLIINMNAKFVHLNNGTKSIEELQFDDSPFEVTRDNFKYDGKKKQLIIGESIFPWKSPKWVKNVQGSYTGSQVPKKKTKIQGDWILDRHEKIIYLILNYAPIVRR